MSLGQSEILEVTDRITLHRYVGTRFNEGNIGCICMDDGLLFVDAGRLITAASNFRQQMEEKYEKKAKLLILTHSHMDHLYGMTAFKDIPTVIAFHGKVELDKLHREGLDTKAGRKARLDKLTKNIIDENPPWIKEWLEDYVPNQIESDWFDPQILVHDSVVFTDGSHEVEFKVCGGHSPCSAYLYDKTSKVMFTGDNLNSEHADSGPCMLARAYLGMDLMKEWLEMDIKKFIPGHGKVIDKKYLKISLNYFTNLHESLTTLKQQHVPEEEIFSHRSIPNFYEEKTPDFLNRILSLWYQNIEVS